MIKKNCNSNTMWIYGKHAVKAALQNTNRNILRIVALEACKNFLDECGQLQTNPEIVDKNFFIRTFGKEATHQGCAVLADKLCNCHIDDLIANESDMRPVIFLDQVSDPQNIGSILRAAAVFGARAVVVVNNSSPGLTSTAAKAASGAVELVPLISVVNLVNAINNFKKHGFWCIGLDERSDKKIHETPLDGKFVFVLGSEGTGMRRLTRETCDFLVQLPCFGEFSTLNVSQVATVSLYEMLRRRM